MIKEQFTLYMENRPGELARVADRLAKAKVNIDGISVANSAEVALVQLVVSRAIPTRRELKAMGIAFTVQQVVCVPLPNKPGTLARLSTRLAAKGININYIYATGGTCTHGCGSYVVISTPDLERADRIASRC